MHQVQTKTSQPIIDKREANDQRGNVQYERLYTDIFVGNFEPCISHTL